MGALFLLWLASAGAEAASPPPAPPLPPETLGMLTLNSNSQDYPVTVPSCATFGSRLVRLKLRARTGAAQVGNLQVSYADRQFQKLPVQRVLREGDETSWLDLGVHGFHDKRCAAELHLNAKSVGPYPNAVLEVTGQSENEPN